MQSQSNGCAQSYLTRRDRRVGATSGGHVRREVGDGEKPQGDAGPERCRVSGELSGLAACPKPIERFADRLDRLGQNVIDEEEDDSGRCRSECRLPRARESPQPACRQAEEDRPTRECGQDDGLGKAHLFLSTGWVVPCAPTNSELVSRN